MIKLLNKKANGSAHRELFLFPPDEKQFPHSLGEKGESMENNFRGFVFESIAKMYKSASDQWDVCEKADKGFFKGEMLAMSWLMEEIAKYDSETKNSESPRIGTLDEILKGYIPNKECH